MGNRGKISVVKRSDSEETTSLVLVTPEVFPEERIERRIQILSVQVPVEMPANLYQDHYDPMENATEQLSERATELGATAVMAVSVAPLTNVSNSEAGKATATGYHKGHSIYLEIPDHGRVNSELMLVVWGMAVILN